MKSGFLRWISYNVPALAVSAAALYAVIRLRYSWEGWVCAVFGYFLALAIRRINELRDKIEGLEHLLTAHTAETAAYCRKLTAHGEHPAPLPTLPAEPSLILLPHK